MRTVSRISGDTPQREAQFWYDQYMAGEYEAHYQARPESQEPHYDQIRKIVYNKLLETRGQIKTLYLLGPTRDDLLHGGLKFDYKPNVDDSEMPTLGELLASVDTIVMHDISAEVLEGTIEEMRQKFASMGKGPSGIVALIDDIGGGVPGHLMSFLKLGADGQGGEEHRPIRDIVTGLSQSLDLAIQQVYQNGRYNDVPHAELGFSLMVHTATLVPLKERLMYILEQECTRPDATISLDEGRELIFNLVSKYNTWLYQKSLANWLQHNQGELTIITDCTTCYYTTNDEGQPNFGDVDPAGEFSVLNSEHASMLTRRGMLVTLKGQWKWLDEGSHMHEVIAEEVSKKPGEELLGCRQS